MTNARRPPRRARGFALIEVLVSVLVFSIGVLGMVAMQARASTYAVDSEDRMRAALLADDLIATMWAQQTTSISSDALSAWESRLSDGALGLPGSPSYTVSTSSGVTTIEITWHEPTRLKADGKTAATSRYTTQVVIP